MHMIKGAQKQMIVLRTGNSRYFDEAYFVLRKEIQAKQESKDDMLREANRILEESALHRTSQKKNRTWLFFGIGIILGAAIGGILIFLLL